MGADPFGNVQKPKLSCSGFFSGLWIGENWAVLAAKICGANGTADQFNWRV